MKITTKLNIAGYSLLAISWIVWLMLDHPERFWATLPIQICALVTFGISLGIGIYRNRAKAAQEPPQGHGEPRQQ